MSKKSGIVLVLSISKSNPVINNRLYERVQQNPLQIIYYYYKPTFAAALNVEIGHKIQ